MSASSSREQLLADAAARAQNYLAALPERAVSPMPAAIERLTALDAPLPENPQDAAGVLAQTR